MKRAGMITTLGDGTGDGSGYGYGSGSGYGESNKIETKDFDLRGIIAVAQITSLLLGRD